MCNKTEIQPLSEEREQWVDTAEGITGVIDDGNLRPATKVELRLRAENVRLEAALAEYREFVEHLSVTNSLTYAQREKVRALRGGQEQNAS